jgi:hypothetical protein
MNAHVVRRVQSVYIRRERKETQTHKQKVLELLPNPTTFALFRKKKLKILFFGILQPHLLTKTVLI